MTKEEKIDAIKQRARKNFSLGYNCAECVTEAVLAFVDTGLPPEVRKVATGFGGGIGLYGDTCGALTGAVIAVSCVHGRENLPAGCDFRDTANKARQQLYGNPGIYRIFNQIPNKFFAKYGSICCRDLTSQWQNDRLCKERALFCRELITDAAGIAAELVLTSFQEAATKTFGKNMDNLEQQQETCDLTAKGT
jgi:C_GCAxxG_C_C family probable redox protein